MMIVEKPVPDTGLRRVIRANVVTVAFEVVVPMALFYGLRVADVSQWWALMAGVLVAAPYVVWTVVRNRRVSPRPGRVERPGALRRARPTVGRPAHARDP
jgi:hypothetical protein